MKSAPPELLVAPLRLIWTDSSWTCSRMCATSAAAMPWPSRRLSVMAWLTAVLKNKIVDLVCQRAGTDSLEDQNDADGALGIACPQPGPHHTVEQRQLLAHTLVQIDALPAPLRAVMQLRILQDQSTEAVCKALAITPDNLFVRLHRARQQLMH